MTATLTAATLAEVLHESNVPLLSEILRVLGTERTTDLLVQTLQCEAAGGMRTNDGTRRPAPGGTFLQLVRQQASLEEHRRLFPGQALPQALTMERVLNTLLPVVTHPWVKQLTTACLAAGVGSGDGWILADSHSHHLLRWGGDNDNLPGAGISVGIASWERPMPLPLPVHTISLVSPLQPVSLSSMAPAQRTLTSRRAQCAMSALRTQWGLPPYGPLFIVGLENLPSWDGYVLSVWGTLEHTTPHPDEAPLFQVRGALRSRGMLSLVAWVRQVFYHETAAYLETRWDPEIGVSMKIVGEDALRRFARLPGTLEEKLKRGLQLLDEACFVGPGRSKGSTLIPAPEFRERYSEIDHQLRNHFGRRPTHEQVASELGVTERTLRRYRRNHGLP